MVLISVRMSLPFFGALVTDDEMRAGGGAAVVVVTAASFSSSPISVTGTSLVSMILVDEMDELRNLLTMFFGDSFFPGLFPAPLPPFPFPLFELTFDGGVPVWFGGSVIGTRFLDDGETSPTGGVVDDDDSVVVDVVVVVDDVVGLFLIHGGSGRSVVVVVVVTTNDRECPVLTFWSRTFDIMVGNKAL
jgi:hypothetical protein